jgi:hypothetical protein
MAIRKTPFALVKDEGGKEAVVDELVGLLDRGDETKEELKQRLLKAANSKLLHLRQVAREVQKKFGSKEGLVEALLGAANRTKDRDYGTRLMRHSIGRLLDMHRSLTRRSPKRAA